MGMNDKLKVWKETSCNQSEDAILILAWRDGREMGKLSTAGNSAEIEKASLEYERFIYILFNAFVQLQRL
jgi:hypothetical protein